MISKYTVILCYSHQLICKPKPCFKVDPLWQWVCQLEIRSMEGMSRNPAFGTWKPDFFSSQMEVSNGGSPYMAGWLWKIPKKNGWFRGTPILGNLQIAIFVPLPRDTSPLGWPDRHIKNHGEIPWNIQIPQVYTIDYTGHIPYFPIFSHMFPCCSMFFPYFSMVFHIFPWFSIAFSIHHHPKHLGIPNHFVREGPQGAPRQGQGVLEAIVFHLGADHVMEIYHLLKRYTCLIPISISISSIYLYLYLYLQYLYI